MKKGILDQYMKNVVSIGVDSLLCWDMVTGVLATDKEGKVHWIFYNNFTDIWDLKRKGYTIK